MVHFKKFKTNYPLEKDEIGCAIFSDGGIFMGYILNMQKNSYADFKKLFDTYNATKICLYTNSTLEELKDFIDFLETLKHNFVIFIQE